jgi:hypothetical protein
MSDEPKPDIQVVAQQAVLAVRDNLLKPMHDSLKSCIDGNVDQLTIRLAQIEERLAAEQQKQTASLLSALASALRQVKW